jgi:formate hydrogenlyase subunit 3/multisubunit Na+/H+ antiporter MnhD subunit
LIKAIVLFCKSIRKKICIFLAIIQPLSPRCIQFSFGDKKMDPLSLAPLPLLVAAILAARRPGRRPGAIPAIAEGAALAALALAAAGGLWLILKGPAVVALGSGPGLLALRLDPVSVTMGLLVAFVGWVVVRYSRRYMD